jgi:hypothetical protein
MAVIKQLKKLLALSEVRICVTVFKKKKTCLNVLILDQIKPVHVLRQFL